MTCLGSAGSTLSKATLPRLPESVNKTNKQTNTGQKIDPSFWAVLVEWGVGKLALRQLASWICFVCELYLAPGLM